VHVWRPSDGRSSPPPALVDGVRRVTDLRGVVDLV
jgi:hypothetical protein